MVKCIECIYCKVATNSKENQYFFCMSFTYSKGVTYLAFDLEDEVNCSRFFLRPQMPSKNNLDEIEYVLAALSGNPPFAKRKW